MNRIKLFHVLSIVIVLAMALAACGGTATTPAPTSAPGEPTAAPEPTEAGAEPTEVVAPTEETEPQPEPSGSLFPSVDPSTATGDIITAGSSTVFPVTERMAELFQQEGYTGNVTVDSIGTGAGFERFCVSGESDISNASRPIKGTEVEACQAIGREPLEFRVGTDALAVVVHPESPIAERGLSLEELGQIFNGDITTWAELDPSLPAETIQIYSPGTDSGTFDYFVEAALGDVADGLLAIEGAQFSEDDNVLAQGVEGSPYAIGYFGYAYYAEAGDKLAALAIDGVLPSQDAVDNNTYPLSRPLFIYSTAAIMQEKPQVATFIGFYLSQLADNIVDVGYFPAPAKDLFSAWGAWISTYDLGLDPSTATGDIITAGSSTVFPVTERMAELFQQEGYTGNVTVDSIGTGAGFERFCVSGESDISNASRPIKGTEVEACQAIGREPLEFRVGTDALAVVVHPESPIAERGLSLEELGQIFNGDITTWAELDPSLPAETIQIYSPGTDSGTFDYFVEAALGDVADGLLAIEGAQFSEDDNVLAQGVEGSPYAIGYFGYAYYAEAGDKLAALAIDGVLPSQDAVDNNTYPLSRPLFIYSTAAIMQEKPQVATFIGFYLSQLADNIVDVGYFPAPAKDLFSAWGAWYLGASGM